MSQDLVYELLKKNKGKWFNYKQILNELKKNNVHVTNSTITCNVSKLLKWKFVEAGISRTKRGQAIRKFRVGR